MHVQAEPHIQFYMGNTMTDLEAIRQLEKNGLYKVIARLIPPAFYHEGQATTPRIGIVLDTETTGLDTSADNIIELGFIAFEYDASSGRIYKILHTYGGFEDPGEPLSEVVMQVTGITDAMLKDQHLNDAEMNQWLEKADLIIAHNSAFDRPMVERRFPKATDCNWACTFADIDWSEEDISSLKLDYIAYKLGYFFDGHRAVNDAQATLHVLTKPLPNTGKLAMTELLNHARFPSRRFFAVGAPFEKKDDLRNRGYRWMPEFSYKDSYNKPKKGVWSKSVAEEAKEDEAQWLNENIYDGKKDLFTYHDVSAKHRYSVREFLAD